MASVRSFARVGLMAAVAMVIGASTFASLLKQPPPADMAALVAAASPPPTHRPVPEFPVSVGVGSPSAAPAAPAVATPKGTEPRLSTADPDPPGFAVGAIPAPAIPADAPPVASASAFPEVQPLTDESSLPPQPISEAAPQPQPEKPPAAKRKAETKRKPVRRPPPPEEIRENFAGRW